METKRIICLANSRKGGSEHCVAGMEVLPSGALGSWIRPTGSGHEGALLAIEQSYEDNTSARVLDLLDVHLIGPNPEGCQTENWVVDGTRRWIKSGEVDVADVLAQVQPNGAFQPPATLFLNAGNTGAGLNDEIPTELSDTMHNSLLLVHAPAVALHVIENWGKIKCQARFAYNGVTYWILVTDPLIEAQFRPGGPGVHNLGSCLLCVSLTAPFVKTNGDGKSYRFKVIAAVMRLP